MSNRTLRDGIVVGLIGYFAVAVLYAVFDLIAARGMLHTVDMLGKAVFRDLRDPGVLQMPMELDVAAIIWYSGLHLVLSLAIGMIVTSLIAYSEQHPEKSTLVLLILIAGFVVTVAAVGMLTSGFRELLPWWSIVVANILAVICAGAYLVRQRPGTWQRLSPFAGRNASA